MASRRAVVIGLGGALVAGSVAGTWRVMRLPDASREPWRMLARPVADPRLDVLRHAILAPNPHNRQPWLIRLEGDDAALLTCDPAKRLPETDPFDRQITIGFGCFIELAAIAASRRGFRLEVEPFPQGEPQPRLDARPLARLRLVADSAVRPDPLFAAIAERRTNRGIYAPLPPGMLARVAGGDARASEDPALLGPLRDLAVAAITREVQTQRTWLESVRLMRIGAGEIDAMPDGLALTGPMIEATALAGLTTRETLADPASSAFRLGLEELQRVYGSIPAAAWIVTPDNSRTSQLGAGRSFARLALRAARLGAAIHPLSQSLQEYPEMSEHYAAARRLLGGEPAGRVQMLARLGLADPVIAAARYPLDAHLRQ